MDLKQYIAGVKDFPKEGIYFRDITPLLLNPEAYKEICSNLANYVKSIKATAILAPESRGFIFGCPVANSLGIKFIPVRKPGKLPRETVSETYDLEYGKDTLQIHKDSLTKDDKVVIIDDLLATGGTVLAAIKLANKLGAEVVGLAFAIELASLKGREKLKNYSVHSEIVYED